MPLILCYFDISSHGRYNDYNKYVIQGLAGQYFFPIAKKLKREKKQVNYPVAFFL